MGRHATALPDAIHAGRTLANGVRLAVTPLPHAPHAHVCVLLRGGPMHETDGTWGLSHLVEHMVFRGAGPMKDVRAVTLRVDDLGGELGAATYHDRILFDTRCDPAHVPAVFDVLRAMLTAPRLADLGVERAIVEAEIAGLFDDDGRELDADNLMFRHLFAGHGLSRAIEGNLDTLKRFRRPALLRFWRELACGGNIVVSVAGPVAVTTTLRAAARAFGGIAEGPPPAFGTPSAPLRRTSIVRADDGGQELELRLAWATGGFKHDDAAAVVALARLLDDGPASRLQSEIVDARGLAYTVWALADLYETAGALEVGASVRPEKAPRLVAAVADQIERIKRAPPQRAEHERLVARAERDMRALLADASAVAEMVGKGVLFSDPFAPRTALARLKAVKPAQVQQLARRLLTADAVRVVAVGPLSRGVAQGVKRSAQRLSRSRS